MKKLILMTSALTLVGGAASAAITISAEAELTYGNWDGAAVAGFGNSVDVTLALEETAANGITYGAEVTIDAVAGTIGNGVVWVSTGALKFSFGIDEFDAVTSEGGDDSGDIELKYEAGGITATLTAEIDNGTEVGDVDPNDWNLNVEYDGGSFTLGLEADSNDWAELSASVDLGGFEVGGAVDNASPTVWDVWASTSLGMVNAKLTYDSAGTTGIELDGEAGDLAWEATWNTLNEITASVEYTMADLTVGIEYDSTNAGGVGDDAETIATVTYDATDMLSVGFKVNDANEYEASLTMGFDF